MFKAFHYFAPVALIASSLAHAVVVRHDVPDSEYLVPEGEFPALADLPDEGHGILIAKQWVVTVAHAVRWGTPTQISLNGKNRAVADLIVHPGYRKPPKEPKSGDAAPLMAALASSDDIALIRLAEPIDDVTPVEIYRRSDEQGKLIKIYGKGATGNGLKGQEPNSPHRGKLRRAYNYVVTAEGRWLTYVFDSGSTAHPLEGMQGDGDSGGPVLIEVGGTWKLAGLASHKIAVGDLSEFRAGVYGQVGHQTRISYYAGWIDGTIAAQNSTSL